MATKIVVSESGINEWLKFYKKDRWWHASNQKQLSTKLMTGSQSQITVTTTLQILLTK